MKIKVLNGGLIWIHPKTGAWTILEDGDTHPEDFASEADIPANVGPYEVIEGKAAPAPKPKPQGPIPAKGKSKPASKGEADDIPDPIE